jgi:hypothetical protein
MLNLLKFYWLSSPGYRLRPWKSPYIQWRFETFLGKEAANLDAHKFLHLSWKYRRNLHAFANWAAQRRQVQNSRS